jgi:uncharacterized repeat protein (TIGR01451 family)
VLVRLLPILDDEEEPASHRLGTVPAGETKVIEIELAARQSGPLTIRAEAAGDHGLKSAASIEVQVRKASLQLTVVGPKKQYAGATGTYEFRVENPGDAPAEHVKVVAQLPEQVKHVSSTAGGQVDDTGALVTWNLDSIPAGGSEAFSLKCAIGGAGQVRVDVTATADSDLKQSTVVETEILALADLVLEVKDPAGPVAVGEDMTYEVRVLNRGSRTAEKVELVAFFSNGIEPVSVEGGSHEISPGTVMFKPIASIGAGREVRFKIKAKAEISGNLRCRVELECKALGTRLTHEETTLFYGDDAAEETTASEEASVAEETSANQEPKREPTPAVSSRSGAEPRLLPGRK